MRISLFWVAVGFASYWAMQHVTGIGNTGRKTGSVLA
jgi:hypothetical protein